MREMPETVIRATYPRTLLKPSPANFQGFPRALKPLPNMPLYEISHAAPLNPSQKDALAEAITDIHSRAFQVPRMYINVFFTDASLQPTYVGGSPVSLVLIIALLDAF